MASTPPATRAVTKVRKVEADLEAARAELGSVLDAEHEAGVSIAELGRQTGLSRQAIYKWIGRHQTRPDD